MKRLFGHGNREETSPEPSEPPAGRARFVPIESGEDLKAILEGAGPSLVFLHDPWCPISGRAAEEMERTGRDVPTIDVAARRDLSAIVAEFTGVRHESPQAIVLRDGRVTWTASHRGVTAKAVLEALSE